MFTLVYKLAAVVTFMFTHLCHWAQGGWWVLSALRLPPARPGEEKTAEQNKYSILLLISAMALVLVLDLAGTWCKDAAERQKAAGEQFLHAGSRNLSRRFRVNQCK